MSLPWVPREPPLPVAGLVAEGAARVAVLRRLLQRQEAAQAGVSGVVGDDLVVLLGVGLPWVDGVTWIGRDAHWPGLYLPTLQLPDVPLDLLWARLRTQVLGPSPILLLPGRVVALGAARPVDDGLIETALEPSR